MSLRSFVYGRHAAALWLGALVVSCSGAAANRDDEAALQAALDGVDHTLCEFRGQTDRVEILTQGKGALAANVRRVYGVGNERDGRRILRCREVDTNLDGKKDIVRIYDERGEPEGEQADSNYDGKMDTWVEFASGVVSRAAFDRNRDGEPDEFRTYSEGHLARVQRDTTFDGQLDTWEVYEKGRLRRVGIDEDGDQRVDTWHRHEDPKSEPEVPTSESRPSSVTAPAETSTVGETAAAGENQDGSPPEAASEAPTEEKSSEGSPQVESSEP